MTATYRDNTFIYYAEIRKLDEKIIHRTFFRFLSVCVIFISAASCFCVIGDGNLNLKTLERGVAQMNKMNRSAKSLCAVFLSLALIFFAPSNVFANAPDMSVPVETLPPSLQTAAESESYIYSVTITFGSFDFYYDYGTWDSQNLKYAANASSKNPAADTVDTFPGWYGFDGTANKITVENMSVERPVRVKVEYTASPLANDATDNASFPLREGSVTMSCYENPELTQPASGSFTNGCSFTVDGSSASVAMVSKEIFVSFSGKPVNKDGTDFKSAQAQRIGYITLTVSLPD